MNRAHRVVLIAALASTLALAAARAQDVVPNGGFEIWDSGQPVDWITSLISYPGSIAQTSDAHSGSWAVQGFVTEFIPGINVPPFLQTEQYPGFPVTQRWTAVRGFYKSNSVSFDAFYVTVYMYRNGAAIGAGYYIDSTSRSTYSEFVVPIQYAVDSIPDSGYVYLAMFPTDGSEIAHLGSWFKADDVTLSMDSGNGSCPIAVSGDASGDGEVKSSDIIYLVNYVLKAGPAPVPCEAAGDANGDGEVKSSDIIYVVNYVLKAGPAPVDICALIPGVWSCP